MGDLRDLESLELAYLERFAQRASTIRALSGMPAGPTRPLPATPIPQRPGMPAPFAAQSFAPTPGGKHGELMRLASAVLEAEEQAWTRWADAIARKAASD